MANKTYHKKNKIEWSKFACAMLIIYGMANGIMYHIEVLLDKMPDPTLATQCVITILGGFLSYLLYQFGLKNSRNKYGIDADGQPFRVKDEDPNEFMEE